MVTSSTIIQNDLQVDGRRWITELHVDTVQGDLYFTYLAQPTDDVDAIMAARAAAINAQDEAQGD